jgi:hypothetical protein
MSKKPQSSEHNVKLQRLQYQIQVIKNQIWPINWKRLSKIENVLPALENSTRVVKSLLVIWLIGIIASSGLLIYSIYMLSTEEAPKKGGQITEVIDNSEISNFNPVLSPSSQAENKITSLLYHPLYRVQYPDFLDGVSEPKIQPILLESEPTWQESEDKTNSFKILEFKLKKDVQWSNKTPITIEDIAYSFERLKEGKGNSQFSNLFKNIEFKTINENTFTLTSNISNPQLKYQAGFSPISKKFYDSQITDRLYSDSRSSKPTVTSGYFTILNEKITDPNSTSSQKIDNPIRNPKNNSIKTVVLDQNPVQNLEDNLKISKYIFNKVDSIFNDPNISNTLEKEAKLGNVDIYSRSLGTNLGISSANIKERTGLNQKIIPTNTYYSLFLNMQVGNYFVNKSLRQYVICQFLEYQLSPNFNNSLTSLPKEKRLIPLQLRTDSNAVCPAEDQILEPNVYQLNINPETKAKSVLLRGSEVRISLLGLPENESLLLEIQKFFDQIGLPTDIINTKSEITKALEEKSYLAAFLPITYISPDIYPIYGANGQNLSNIRENNRIKSNIEQAMLDYSLSKFTDTNAKNILTDFFQNEYASLTLFKSNYEFNYSNRVRGLGDSLPNNLTFTTDLYLNTSNWFTETKRQRRK